MELSHGRREAIFDVAVYPLTFEVNYCLHGFVQTILFLSYSEDGVSHDGRYSIGTSLR